MAWTQEPHPHRRRVAYGRMAGLALGLTALGLAACPSRECRSQGECARTTVCRVDGVCVPAPAVPEDAAPADGGPAAGEEDAGTAHASDGGPGGADDTGGSCPTGRQLEDRPDDTDLPQVHVLYVVPADGMDRALDTSGVIAGTVTSGLRWMRDAESGTAYRMDTCGGVLDISFLRLPVTDATIRAEGRFARDLIEREVRAAGFNREDRIYLAYYDGTSLGTGCGSAGFPPTREVNVPVMFLNGEFADPQVPPCAANPLGGADDDAGYMELSMIHELLHASGAVLDCAPHHANAHVDDDPQDIMYAGPAPWTPVAVDIDHDDYFGHGRSDCYDVGRHPMLTPAHPDPAYPPTW